MPDATLTREEIQEAMAKCQAAQLLWPSVSIEGTEDDRQAKERFRLMAQAALPCALRELLEAREDSERLNAIEEMARAYCQREFDLPAGFFATADGDLLSGVIEDYPYKSLRAAIDAARKGEGDA